MIGIYKITSPKGRVYIGQSIDILYRFKKYKQMQCKGQVRLYNSFLKHNVENHLFEIAKLAKQHGGRCIMFIQSNRFYNNMKFDFINELGESKVLERAEKQNNSFYGYTFNLHNTEHLERIKNESIK